MTIFMNREFAVTIDNRPSRPPSPPQVAPPITPEDRSWRKLTGTGFNVELEIDHLIRNVIQDKTGLAAALREVRGNLIGFKTEYLLQKTLLPNPIDIKEIKGRRRVVSGLSGLPLLEMITPDERLGAVKDSFAKIEDFLLTAPRGSMAIMASPLGESGLHDQVGQKITYPDSQTYMFRVGEDGKPSSYTLVTSMDFRENRELLKRLGLPEINLYQGKTELEKTANITRNVAFLDGEAQPTNFRDIITTIQHVRKDIAKTSIARLVNTPYDLKPRFFDEAYSDLSRGEELLNLDQTHAGYIERFEQFVQVSQNHLNHSFTRLRLEEELAKTVLDMTGVLYGSRKAVEDPIKDHAGITGPRNYAWEMEILRRIPGCNGGGGVGAIFTPFGPRITVNSSKEQKTIYTEGFCKDCQKTKSQVGQCHICIDCERTKYSRQYSLN